MTVTTHNGRGQWVPAIPLPYFGIRKRCHCGRRFWTIDGYRSHYALAHILALAPDPQEDTHGQSV